MVCFFTEMLTVGMVCLKPKETRDSELCSGIKGEFS